MAVIALFGSMLIFGTGDLMVLKSDMVSILDSHDVLWRYIAAFGFAALSMITVASLAFLLSVFAETSIGTHHWHHERGDRLHHPYFLRPSLLQPHETLFVYQPHAELERFF